MRPAQGYPTKSGPAFQSTHPAGGATLVSWSTRALTSISIHAPRRGCDPSQFSTITIAKRFQSTHPAGGATQTARKKPAAPKFQSTHPAGGATYSCQSERQRGYISIHAPRRGCDQTNSAPSLSFSKFQSTHPAGGATRVTVGCIRHEVFQSTHPAGGATY